MTLYYTLIRSYTTVLGKNIQTSVDRMAKLTARRQDMQAATSQTSHIALYKINAEGTLFGPNRPSQNIKRKKKVLRNTTKLQALILNKHFNKFHLNFKEQIKKKVKIETLKLTYQKVVQQLQMQKSHTVNVCSTRSLTG